MVAMGVALLLLQTAEKVLRLCMTFVLQKAAPLTLDSLLAQEESERNKTLGYFLAELRKRADIHPTFDQLLNDFLKNRNDFIHDLSRVPGWDAAPAERVTKRKQFVHRLIRQSDVVLKVFAGLVRSWQEQAGFQHLELPSDAWFAEVERIYKPLAENLFLSKDV